MATVARRSLIASLVALVTLGSGVVWANFKPGRIDATPGDTAFRTWLALDSGSVVSRQDRALADGTSSWIYHGAGSSTVKSEGVAAAGYMDGADRYEHVVYVGTDGQVNLGTVINGGPISWVAFSAPAGTTLTGHITASVFFSAGIRHLVIGATTTDNKLLRNVRVIPGGTGLWDDSSGGLSWLTTSPLASSVSTSGLIV